MPRFILKISYKGTNYAGWQIQPNAPTVQAEIERALSIALRRPVTIYGSGRTDAGVHARGQVAHFDAPDLSSAATRDRLRRSLNGLLPNDIFIQSIAEVPCDFHARFDADYRTYHYYFSDAHQPLHAQTTGFFPHLSAFEAMQQAAACIRGNLDCQSFTPFDPALPHHRCWFFESHFLAPDHDGRHCYVVTANRFLRNLVRSLVGTLMEVGSGKMSVASFETLFHAPDRSRAGTTAPAKGLVLHEVGYDGRWKLPVQP